MDSNEETVTLLQRGMPMTQVTCHQGQQNLPVEEFLASRWLHGSSPPWGRENREVETEGGWQRIRDLALTGKRR